MRLKLVPITLTITFLIAFGQKGSFAQSILDTKLEVTVRDDAGNIVEDATVTIYKSETDYNQKKNAVETKQTDLKGRATFGGLSNQPYFLDVQKGDLDNVNAGIKTEALMPKRKNQFTVIIS